MLHKRADEVSKFTSEFFFDTNIHMVIEWCSSEAILTSCLNIYMWA